MGWFNSTKIVNDIMDKDNGLIAQVGGWVGNMELTKEEVLEVNAKTVVSVQKFVEATLSENTERSKTRRSIAVMWIKLQVALVLVCSAVAPFDLELAEFYYNLATSTLMITVTTAISIFFFGSNGIARYHESKK